MYPGRLEELVTAEMFRVRGIRYTERAEPAFLPIVLTGGIGDVILSAHTLRRLRKEGFSMIVSSPHAEAFQYFCQEIPISPHPLPDLTWRLEIDSIARFRFEKGFTGFLVEEHRALFNAQVQWFHNNPGVEWLVDKYPQDKFLLTRLARIADVKAWEMPLVSLGFSNTKVEENEFRMWAEDHITIHDGYDANYQVSGRATKQWEWRHWNSLVAKLKKQFPQYSIIQLGSKTSRPIDGVTTNLIGKTSLIEAFDILSHSQVHIDTDSGLVHAASTMGIPCVTMFGPTPASFYGHDSNINVSRETSCPGSCFHLTRNWMDKCPIGYQTPRCMDDIVPEQVMDSVMRLLK